MTEEYRFDNEWDDFASQEEPPRKGGSLLLWLLLAVVAVAAFAVTFFLVGGHDDKPASTAPTTVQSQETTQGTEPSASSSGASDESSSNSSTAEFPAGYGSECSGGEVSDQDIRTRDGSGSSCDFVTEVKSKVIEKIAQDKAATSFSVSPYSAVNHTPVSLLCDRQNHLTHCTGGNAVDIYVRDNLN